MSNTSEIKLVIDWDALPEWAKYVGIDKDGSISMYGNLPDEFIEMDGGEFLTMTVNEAVLFVENWEQTLVERPRKRLCELVATTPSGDPDYIIQVYDDNDLVNAIHKMVDDGIEVVEIRR